MAALHEDIVPYDSNPMDEQEARQYVAWVKSALEDARTYLYELHERRGWVPLGYQSFQEMCKAEFGYEKTQAYDRVKAARIQLLVSGQPVSGMPEKPVITTRAGVALHEVLDEEGEEATLQAYTDLASSGPVTEQRVRDRRPVQVAKLNARYADTNLAGKLYGEPRPRERRDMTDPFQIQEQALAGWRALMGKFVTVDAALMAEALDEQAYAFVQSSLGILRTYMVDVEAARALREAE